MRIFTLNLSFRVTRKKVATGFYFFSLFVTIDMVTLWSEMIRKRKVITWLMTLLCSEFCSGFFGDNSCPQYATYFEALNTTTDCNGALPISNLGLTGDKFCSNICPDDIQPNTERVFCVLKLWYFTWDPNKFDLKRYKKYWDFVKCCKIHFYCRYRCVAKLEAVPMIP